MTCKHHGEMEVDQQAQQCWDEWMMTKDNQRDKAMQMTINMIQCTAGGSTKDAENTVKAVRYEGHVQHRRGKSRGDKRHNKVVSTVLILVS